MIGNYERILNKIADTSGESKEEIERRVEARRAKLSGLISKEGAAQVIAAELGISFDNEKLKINELLPGMKKVHTAGKVINIFPIREFERNGKSNKVVNFIIADDTSNIKVVLWDTNHIDLIENGKIKIGSVVEIINGSSRENEVHLGSFSELKLSDEIFENVKTEKETQEKEISNFMNMDSIKNRAFIVQIFEPKFFYVCPECKRKAIQEGEGFNCATHGKVVADKRALINFVLDDGTETIRTVLFNEAISSLGLTISDLENQEIFMNKKKDLLGKEIFISGQVRNNKFFNNLEVIAESVQEIDVNKLINILEK